MSQEARDQEAKIWADSCARRVEVQIALLRQKTLFRPDEPLNWPLVGQPAVKGELVEVSHIELEGRIAKWKRMRRWTTGALILFPTVFLTATTFYPALDLMFLPLYSFAMLAPWVILIYWATAALIRRSRR